MSPSNGSEPDAVLVGSGINSLACGALLARAGWHVVVLERNDWLGGCIRTAEITEPGFHHDVLLGLASALGRRRGARAARRRARRARPRVPEHRAADGDRVPRRRGVVPAPQHRRERRGVRPPRARRRRRVARAARRASCRTPTSRSACSAPSSGRRRAWRSAARRSAGSGGAASHEFGGNLLVSGRDWLCDTFASERDPRPARAVGAPHRPRPGHGVVRVHGAGDRGRRAGGRHAGPARRRRAAGRRARAADRGQRRHVPDGRRGRVGRRARRRRGRRPHRRRRDGRRDARRDRERHADAALRPPARQPAGRGRRRGPPLPLRPGRDADPLRALGAAALGRRRAARADGGRARDARPRRRLARRQRGRARPAAGRADGRVRPAADDRPEPRAGRQGHALDPAPGAAVAREGRRGRRARHRRRHVDRRAARAVRRPRAGAARAPHPEPRVGGARAHDPLARRPAGGEPEPRPRRPVRGLARARPELRLAAVPGPARPPHARSTGSGTSARAPGRARASARAPGRSSPRSCCGRRRARACSGGSPASAAPERSCPRRERCGKIAASVGGMADGNPPGSNQRKRSRIAVARKRSALLDLADLDASRRASTDDLEAYAAAGLDGIGIWELKLPEDGDDGAALEAFERSGLESASAVPLVPSILPLPRLGGPTDPAERIDALCASIHRLAPLPPGRHRLPDRHRARARSRRRARDRRRRAAHARRARRSSPACRSRSSRTSATAARSGRSRPRSPRRSS